ncbi:hypothetical protein BJ166DRAFT_572942 [Pestalotiopsis sp. NC0098]|nr:hypothetical protein BJ166DRAFT_572942 [Pestalotiopsis sp. NC0098]
MPLKICHVTTDEEFKSVVEVEVEAYSNPYNGVFEITRGTSQEECYSRQLSWHKSDPSSHWLYVVDGESGQVLGGAQWNIHRTNPYEVSQPMRTAYWLPDGPLKQIGDQLIRSLRTHRPSHMSKPHILLTYCFVHSSHRRRGAASLMLEWGTNKADELGLEAFIESTDIARPAYEKHGFRVIGELSMDAQSESKNDEFDAVAPSMQRLSLRIAFAVGHHLFYASLNGEIVGSPSQQEWYLRIGTGLSFLVRALLSASIGSAYIQLLWYSVKSTATSLKGVDALLGVLHNVWDLAVWELWRTRPILTTVALAIWALPLVAIVTPATLVVGPAHEMREDIVAMPVPIPDYANPLKYAQWQSGGGTWYQGPSARIKRSLSSVASAGAILPVPPPFPNASYSIQFYGPSITCETLENSTSTLSDLFSHNVSDFTSHLGARMGYLGFVPSCHTSLDDSCSHNDTAAAYAALRQELNYTLTRDESLLDPTTHGSPKVYVIVPDLSSYTGFTTITCEPHNSSYSGEITFNNGQQTFNISKRRWNRD